MTSKCLHTSAILGAEYQINSRLNLLRLLLISRRTAAIHLQCIVKATLPSSATVRGFMPYLAVSRLWQPRVSTCGVCQERTDSLPPGQIAYAKRSASVDPIRHMLSGGAQTRCRSVKFGFGLAECLYRLVHRCRHCPAGSTIHWHDIVDTALFLE